MIADHYLVKKGFGPMIVDHDLVKKRSTIMDAEISTHTFLTMIIEESVCFMSCEPTGHLEKISNMDYELFLFFCRLNWSIVNTDHPLYYTRV